MANRKRKRPGGGGFNLIATLCLLAASVEAVIDQAITCPAGFNTARFCDGTKFLQGGKEQEIKTRLSGQDLFDANGNQVREYYFEQEFFEGSISLVQYGAAWKQISTQAADQISTKTGAVKTTQVVKIKHFWQIPHVWYPINSTPLNYNDLRTGTSDPSTNDFREVLYDSPMKGSTYSDLPNHADYQWFIGDFVPMKSCAYIVNMNAKSNGATKWYSFQRIMMSIQYDEFSTVKKRVKIVPDTPFIASSTANAAKDDLMLTHIPINYYWHWRAFYWFHKGTLWIKQDSTYTETADPCQRDTPIFGTTGVLAHHEYVFKGTAVNLVSHAFLYEGVYTVWSDNPQIIYRLEGVPGTWEVGASGVTLFNISSILNYPAIGATAIVQLVSMEFYGIFANLNNKKFFIEIEPDKIMVKKADGTLDYNNAAAKIHKYSGTLKFDYSAPTDTTKSLGIRVREDSPCTTEFKFAQTQGEMHMHRPVWMVCSNDEKTIYRVTTVINQFMQIPATHPMVNWTKLWSFVLQTLRFHIFNIQPGVVDTTTNPNTPAAPGITNKALTGNIQTWQATEVVVVDLRQEDEVLRWPLSTCGDTFVNSTYGAEDCDYAKASNTPINLDNPNTATQSTYNYPAISTDNQRILTTAPFIFGATGVVKSNALNRWSGPVTIWFDPATKLYYNCDLLCKKTAINLCGDGIPSNGRVPNGSGGYKASPDNQEVGTDLTAADAGFELCDDGNNRNGDGCSADCKTIETGFECPRWGIPCNLKCGNGRRNWVKDAGGNIVSQSYQRYNKVTGSTVTTAAGSFTFGQVFEAVEECDLGPYNVNDSTAATYKDHACNANCQVTDKNLWRCTWVEDKDASGWSLGWHSKCEYLCGNRVVDKVDASNGMTISETCDKGVQQWQGQEYIPGYQFPLKNYNAALAFAQTPSSESFTGYYAGTGLAVTDPTYPTAAIKNALLGQAILNVQAVDYVTNKPIPTLSAAVDKCTALPCIGDGSNSSYPYIYYMILGTAAQTGINPTNGLPWWHSNEKDNTDWLVGCDYKCQVIDAANTSIINNDNGAATTIAAALGGGVTAATVTYGMAVQAYQAGTLPAAAMEAAGGTPFKCPATYSSMVDCTDRCGDGIYDGLIYFGNFGRNRSTKPYPTGVNGYTPQNPAMGFDYADRMPVETCDIGTYYPAGQEDRLGYNPEGIGDPTGSHGCSNMCQVEAGWTCTVFFYKMLRRDYTPTTWTAPNSPPSGTNAQTDWYRGVEEPLFRSECWKTADTSKGPWRRRLMPEDFDPHRRFMHHLPQRYDNYRLPLSDWEFEEGDSLKLSTKIGLNGQLRLIEAPCQLTNYGCTNSELIRGIVYAYENTKYTIDDYAYYITKNKGAADVSETILMSANSNALRGKMRNTFGQYLVMNKNLNQIEVWGYNRPAAAGGNIVFAKLWTSRVETSIQYMGAHEFYWWPYNQFLMAKLSDGSSFKFFRMAKEFQAKSVTETASTDSALAWIDRIQDIGYNLFQVNGKVTIPPIFNEKFIYIYTTTSGVGTISAYYYNEARMEMDLVCRETGLSESISLYYQNYSMVKVGTDGFIYHKAGDAVTNLYFCNSSSDVSTWPTTFTKTAVSYVLTSPSPCNVSPPATNTIPLTQPIYCGAASSNTAQVILKQPRDDPETYVSGVIPKIWGWFGNDFFMQLAYTNSGGPKLTPVQSIRIPRQLNLLGVTSTTGGNVYAEQLDIGNNFLAIMSPVQCNAVYAVSAVTSPSVYYYDLTITTVAGISADLVNCDPAAACLNLADGLDDYQTCTPVMIPDPANALNTIQDRYTSGTLNGCLKFTGTLYDPYKGWTCVNLPATEASTLAWQLLV